MPHALLQRPDLGPLDVGHIVNHAVVLTLVPHQEVVRDGLDPAALDVVGQQTRRLRLVHVLVKLVALASLDVPVVSVVETVLRHQRVRYSRSLELPVFVDILHVHDLNVVPRDEVRLRLSSLDFLELVHLLSQLGIRWEWLGTWYVLQI